MGNTFGNYATFDDAAAVLIRSGFSFKADDLGERFVKPSTNGITGAPQTAIVYVREQTIDPKYGRPNYFQHEYI